MRKAILGMAILTLPLSAASFGAIATAGTAGASAPVSCTKATGTITGTLTLKGCGGGLGKGTAPASSMATGGVITWAKHKGATTVGGAAVTSPGQGACKAGSTEYDFTGTVTADTSPAALTGTAVSGRACVTAAGSISLVKHTTVSL